MKNYLKLLDYADGMHNRKVKQERLELVALYYGGILANACNYRLYNQQSDSLEIIKSVTIVCSFYLGTLINSNVKSEDLRVEVITETIQQLLLYGKHILDKDETCKLITNIIDKLERDRLKIN